MTVPTGRVAVITGGTYGIGREIVLAFARAGWRVLAVGTDARQLGSAAEHGTEATRDALRAEELSGDVIDADVTVGADVQRIVAAAGAMGGVDAVVNGAAVRPRRSFQETTIEEWERTISVNLTGVFAVTKALLPLLEGRPASVVNIGSASGWGRAGLAAYAASKGGLVALSQSMAHDLRASGIRVNVVIPAGVASGMVEDDPGGVEAVERAGLDLPAGRPLTGADVAAAVLFLCGDGAAQISGAVLDVGGFFHQATTGRRA